MGRPGVFLRASSPPLTGRLASVRMNRLLLHPSAKPLVFLLCLGPLAWLASGAITGSLGPNPAEALIRHLGDLTLRALCLTLAVTPLRTLAGWPSLARYRRLFGLYAFFYGVLGTFVLAALPGRLRRRMAIAMVGERLRDMRHPPAGTGWAQGWGSPPASSACSVSPT